MIAIMLNNISNLDSVIKMIRQDPRILAAYVLGSAANGTMRPASDLDIAILLKSGTKISSVELFELAADLTTVAKRNVDLGQLSSQNLIYASEALLKGHRFCCQDTSKADLLAATLLGLAMEFQIERKEIIDAYTV